MAFVARSLLKVDFFKIAIQTYTAVTVLNSEIKFRALNASIFCCIKATRATRMTFLTHFTLSIIKPILWATTNPKFD